MAYETLIVEIEDYVSLIRLNRPDAMNALNSTLMRELAAAVTAAEANDKVRCIVITGSDKAFAAGADVREMAEKSFIDVYFEDLFAAEAAAISRARKPMIAAVAGYCLGGGCELAMLCDFIIAADSAKFGQPEINLGIVAGMGGTQRLTRAVGKAKSMDMHLTGRFMDAAEAERCGLVSRVVPAKALIEEAMKAAQKVVEKSTVTAMVVKECVNRAQEGSLAVAFDRLHQADHRGAFVRTADVPRALCDRGPERGHGRLSGKAPGAVPRPLGLFFPEKLPYRPALHARGPA